MENAVTLAQLPYTGFDHGELYNNLFWAALAMWSFLLAKIIILYGGDMMRRRVTTVQDEKTRALELEMAIEPVILSERVVRYDPLADKQVAPANIAATQPIPIMPAPTPTQRPASITQPTVDKEVAERVQTIVDSEIAVSREAQESAEYSAADFSTVDFDGVNPDETWQPREVSEDHEPTYIEKVQNMTTPEPVEPEATPVPAQTPVIESASTQPDNNTKVYKDSIALDSTGEFPKVVLTREAA